MFMIETGIWKATRDGNLGSTLSRLKVINLELDGSVVPNV
jgi:hypothetical protein